MPSCSACRSVLRLLITVHVPATWILSHYRLDRRRFVRSGFHLCRLPNVRTKQDLRSRPLLILCLSGNTVQLAAALCRLFSGPDQSFYFHPADRLALTSLCSFVIGSMFGGQLGDRVGPKKRWWLIGSSLGQAGCLFVAFLALLISGDATVAPDRGDIPINNALGFVAVGFMSGSMGLQAIVGKRLNTAYGTTVVLTTIWTELVADPGLFKPKLVPSRDHRAASIFALLIGGFASRAITNTIGGAASLGIGALLKVMIAFTFYFVPSKVVVAKS